MRVTCTRSSENQVHRGIASALGLSLKQGKLRLSSFGTVLPHFCPRNRICCLFLSFSRTLFPGVELPADHLLRLCACSGVGSSTLDLSQDGVKEDRVGGGGQLCARHCSQIERGRKARSERVMTPFQSPLSHKTCLFSYSSQSPAQHVRPSVRAYAHSEPAT